VTTHGSAAASARRHKERHPELYCVEPRCLWATARSGPCPRHPEPLAPSLKGETFSQLCNLDPSCGAAFVHAIDCDMDEDCDCHIEVGRP
jgi:hypothetical protein